MKLPVITIMVCIIVVLLAGMAFTENNTRRTIGVYKNGVHIMIPNIGECDPGGCVISEHYTEQWNGIRWIHQRIDTNRDGICDIIRVWKPLEDPVHGIYYIIHAKKPCGGVI